MLTDIKGRTNRFQAQNESSLRPPQSKHMLIESVQTRTVRWGERFGPPGQPLHFTLDKRKEKKKISLMEAILFSKICTECEQTWDLKCPFIHCYLTVVNLKGGNVHYKEWATCKWHKLLLINYHVLTFALLVFSKVNWYLIALNQIVWQVGLKQHWNMHVHNRKKSRDVFLIENICVHIQAFKACYVETWSLYSKCFHFHNLDKQL